MAALEKIRKRSAILAIVIGLGLLAFIGEEAAKAMGFLGRDTSALTVGDEKISIQEFSSVQETLQKQNNNKDVDGAILRQQAVQNIITDKITSQECDDAGIDVTDQEILTQLFNETGLDNQTFEQIKNAKPDPNSNDPRQKQLYEAKAYCESRIPEIAKELKQAKLQLAIMGCLKPNKLEMAHINEMSAPYEIEYTKVDYAQYAGKYKVSDEELKEAYNTYKEFFKIDQEQRRISYIKVDLDPSAADIKTAQGNVTKVYNDFASQEGILGLKNHDKANNSIYDNVAIDSLMTSSKSNNLTVAGTNATEQKDATITELLEGGINFMKIKNPTSPKDRKYSIYKVTKIVECPDSLGVNYVFIKGNKQMQDSVLNVIASGVSLDSLQSSNKNENILFNLYNPQQQLPPVDGYVYQDSIREKLKAHLGGDFFHLDTQQSQDLDSVAVYAQVVKHAAPVTLYSIARATYLNEPSETTIDNIRKNLQAYIDKNKTADDFKKNAKAAKYEVQECVVDASYPYINSQMTGPVVGSRDIIYWAFNNKPGAVVTQVMENEKYGYMIIAALEDVYKDYIPYTDPTVKQQLTSYLLNKKIGEDLLKQYNGKAQDVEGYAQLLNSTVENIPEQNQSLQYIGDAKVIGHLIGQGKNAVGKVQVIAGENALYVVKVNKIGTPTQLTKAQYASMYQSVNPAKILIDSRKLFNNTLKFDNPEFQQQ